MDVSAWIADGRMHCCGVQIFSTSPPPSLAEVLLDRARVVGRVEVMRFKIISGGQSGVDRAADLIVMSAGAAQIKEPATREFYSIVDWHPADGH